MIKVGNNLIGKNAPVFIVAEIGINHNGDRNLGMEMIKAAKESGVDAVKFQNYFVEDFILDRNLTYKYISQGVEVEETQYELFKRCELSFEDLKHYKAYCDELGITFFSTPTSKRGIEHLVKLNTQILKNGSDYLVNLPLIKEMAKSGLPTVISTGMATLAEIDDAVRAFEDAGGKDLIILHCISSYPTPPAEVHLNKITSLSKAFDKPIGFSDHTDGVYAAIAAAVLGACFIEKHFTTDKNLNGPDHHFSSDPSEMKLLVEAIRTTEKSLGTSKIGPSASENDGRINFRLSCVASDNFKRGHLLSKGDIAFTRPGNGLPPKFLERLIGLRLTKDLKKGEEIKLNQLMN